MRFNKIFYIKAVGRWMEWAQGYCSFWGQKGAITRTQVLFRGGEKESSLEVGEQNGDAREYWRWVYGGKKREGINYEIGLQY